MKRNWAGIAFIVAVLLVVAEFGAGPRLNPNWYIRAVTAVPADAEIAKETDVSYRRRTVGNVDNLGATRWGLETAYRQHDALRLWRPATLFDRSRATAGSAPAVSLRLEQSAEEIVLSVRQGPMELRLARHDGVWIDSTSPGREAIGVNGKPLKAKGQALRLLAGDYLALDGIDVRIGRFLKLTPVDLKFTTSKLCPLGGIAKRLPWRPNSAERSACAARMVRGTAQLSLSESFGLTKPVFKLTPADGEPAVVVADSFVALTPRTDLQAEVEQMLAYLNAPVTSRPEPNTHFEYSVTNADSMVRAITQVAAKLDTTGRIVNAALRSPGGLAPLVLGKGSNESLRRTLSHTAALSGRLADTSGTLIRNVGLEPVVSNATRTIAHADTTMDVVRAQLLRLTPRAELAVDQVTTSMQSLQGTLQSVNGAAQDVSAIKGKVTSPWTFGIIGLGFVGALAAHLKFIF